jgi:hypothetical protein
MGRRIGRAIASRRAAAAQSAVRSGRKPTARTAASNTASAATAMPPIRRSAGKFEVATDRLDFSQLVNRSGKATIAFDEA